MVPADFDGYFTASSAAAGVLIGLLFVAVSMRPDTIFGPRAPAAGRANAGSAFTCLGNCFFISLVALIPQAGVGIVTIIVSVVALGHTVQLHSELSRQEFYLVMMVLSLLTYLAELVIGILVETHQHSTDLISDVAFVQIALFSVALSRAWTLIQGKHMAPAPSSGDPFAQDSNA
jgi:hypothetical protein